MLDDVSEGAQHAFWTIRCACLKADLLSVSSSLIIGAQQTVTEAAGISSP